jgi:anhydro-N-acetylmuramic acid kinase
MVYRTIGLMSGSSLDGLDIVFAEFHENGGKWTYQIIEADCYPYPEEWVTRLKNATSLGALDYQLLHAEYGHYLGRQVNNFIEENDLHYKAALVASHGHTTFHAPLKKMTAQLGDGAAIAAETQLPVVSDLRALDVAFGGQGAPIVPIGEKLLLGDYDYFLNLGGIANISTNVDPGKRNSPDFAPDTASSFPGMDGGPALEAIAFDICPANRVLNMLAADAGKEFDKDGEMAAQGRVIQELLDRLNELDFYNRPYPKSLANDFGTDIVYPLVKRSGVPIPDALRTYCEHIVIQIRHAIYNLPTRPPGATGGTANGRQRLLATGGGAFNTFLINGLKEVLSDIGIDLVVPDEKLVKFKEALIMALIGVLRWREEYNVIASATGALRSSIGGALWLGQEA